MATALFKFARYCWDMDAAQSISKTSLPLGRWYLINLLTPWSFFRPEGPLVISHNQNISRGTGLQIFLSLFQERHFRYKYAWKILQQWEKATLLYHKGNLFYLIWLKGKTLIYWRSAFCAEPFQIHLSENLKIIISFYAAPTIWLGVTFSNHSVKPSWKNISNMLI